MSLLRQAIAQASLVYKAFSARVGQKMAASAVQPQIRSSSRQSKEQYKQERIERLRKEMRNRLRDLENDMNLIESHKDTLEVYPNNENAIKMIRIAQRRVSHTRSVMAEIQKELTNLGA
ncbi:uncharacterized protein LOC131929921 [Physella acuta]|uniref:uncharacterized protein LOC131929921 n=1 Tax=Physella acuta TaxID=109671 RepID=UPI0027DC1E1E|nr:uncharacterized protein LOC131929921 [Physella acuta]XP_059142295.1 uncharacterized protein LOC131929921 [Physella acuta]